MCACFEDHSVDGISLGTGCRIVRSQATFGHDLFCELCHAVSFMAAAFLAFLLQLTCVHYFHQDPKQDCSGCQASLGKGVSVPGIPFIFSSIRTLGALSLSSREACISFLISKCLHPFLDSWSPAHNARAGSLALSNPE